jgi:hypothetical protein
MRKTCGRRSAILSCCLVVLAALGVTLPQRQAAAQPAGTGTVGTAVHVVIHKSFMETVDDDQCVGDSALATVRRGSSVVLSESSFESIAPRKVAVGQFFRSRLKDGMCEALYITSAPVMPVFAVQFVGPDGALSATYGPIASENVTDQPGIAQAVVVHLEFDAHH